MAFASSMSSRLPRAVAEALAAGASVLTPNQHAAHELRQAFREAMRADNGTILASPEILALDVWMAQLWGRMIAAGDEQSMLLNRAQEHSLWQTILAADAEVSHLTALDPLVEKAAQAWQILCAYEGQSRLREVGVSTDTRAFERWAISFGRTLNKQTMLSAAQLPAVLNAALAAGTLPLPDAGLLLVDFHTVAPAVERLFNSIQQAGYTVGHHRTSVESAAAPQCLTAPDEQAELEAAAQWIAETLEHDPTARIALVVPNLADRRTHLERTLRQCLPATFTSARSYGADTFEFSLGTPLADTPMVAVALDLLRWTLEPLPLEIIGELLLSPFFAGAKDSDLRNAALLDVSELRRMRLLLRPELTLEETIAIVAPKAERLSSLLQSLRAMHYAAKTEQVVKDRPRSHAEWSDVFRKILEASGWSAATGRGSLEWQTHRRFESALDELATLDFDGSRLNASQALRTLTRLAREALFAPESRQAPVQILGPLELGGVAFDALWFVGAGDLRGLPTPSASPLIAWQLQQSLGVPGTESARDRASAIARMSAIAHAADRVVFSYAEQTEEGRQRLTPALHGLTLDPSQATPRHHPPPQPLERILDETKIPSPDIQKAVAGGVRVLELQSACAFRAFAEIRLNSEEPELRAPGLNAMERGNLVHSVMEYFWADLEGQHDLNLLSTDEREQHLDTCIQRALAKASRGAASAWDVVYLATQHKRLHHLLRPWLELESSRPPFTVRQRERGANHVSLGPLLLNLRPDRVDETPDGLVILDYKTGAASPADWLTERPDAPQLPLYATLAGEKVAGVAFALLHPGDGLALKGLADSPGVFGKPARMQRTLDEQMEQWRESLTGLAIAFYEGDTRVSPKQYPITCAFCSQRIVCRLNPATLDASEDASEDSETIYG